MYAIVETGGKQFRVSEGDVIRTDLIETEVGASVTFNRVILHADGDDVKIGAPLVSGVTVTGTVLRQAKDKKILVFRYKPKKRVRKLNGHRQRFAEVRFRRDSRDRLSSVFSSGHAEQGEPGEDVVCSAVSALLQAAWAGLTDV